MATTYPGTIDTFTNPASTDTLASVPHAAQHDNANDAIKAIETTLGTNPQGGSATVSARIATMVPLSTVTTKGDVIAATGPGAVTRLGAGTNNQILVADSSQTAGLRWSSSLANSELIAPKELWTVSATAATGTIQFDCITQGVLYYTTASAANWNLNFRGNSTTTLDSVMNVGDAITVSFLATNTTAFYQSTAVTVDTSATVTVKWSGASAPTTGTANAIDAYSYTIVKTGSSTFTVLCAGPIKYA